jgi:hypothetical protein
VKKKVEEEEDEDTSYEPQPVPQGLPAKIKIGPYTYRVEGWLREDAIKERVFGDYDAFDQRIRLVTHLPPETTADSALHEVLHTLWEVMGIGGGQATEERAVRAMATGLSMVMKDNPGLMQQLENLLRGV